MKVLSVTWAIFDNQLKEFMTDYSGGGLVIKNICEYIGRKEESYLLLGRYTVPEMDLGNIHIIKTDYDANQKNTGGQNTEYIQYLTGIFEKTVDELKPDIVNFHGGGDFVFSCINNVCKKKNIRFVLTCHLFIGKEKLKYTSSYAAYIEEVLFNMPDIQLIAVSNGMKKRILEDYPHWNEQQIEVLINGTDFTPVLVENNIREIYELREKKVLLCAGTISTRKNQKQILQVFEKNPDLAEKIAVIFCGKKAKSEMPLFEEEIVQKGLEKSLIYVGAVANEEMKVYYSVAEGLIMPSYAEGLSIAALEAIAYGLPVIMFRDSECADDLDDANVVCFAEARSDEALAKAIWNWYGKEWDREYIKEYSKYFSMERMAEDYLEFYKKIIN